TNPADNQFLRHNGTNWVNEAVDIPANIADLGDVGPFTNLEANQHLVYNGTDWVNHAGGNTSIDLDNLSDVEEYPGRNFYRPVTPTATFNNAVAVFSQVPPGFTGDPENDIFFLENANSTTFEGLPTFSLTRFNQNVHAGPYTIIRSTSTEFNVYRPGQSTWASPAERAAIQAELAAIPISPNNPVGVRAINRRLGPTEDGEILQWNQTNDITGAGDWEYETVATVIGGEVDSRITAQVDSWARTANPSEDVPDGKLGNVEVWALQSSDMDVEVGKLGNVPILAWVTGTEYSENDLVTNGGIIWRALRTTPVGDRATAPAEGDNWAELGSGGGIENIRLAGETSDLAIVSERVTLPEVTAGAAGLSPRFPLTTDGEETRTSSNTITAGETQDFIMRVARRTGSTDPDAVADYTRTWEPVSDDLQGIEFVRLDGATTDLAVNAGRVEIPDATATSNGLLPLADKTKLDDIPVQPTEQDGGNTTPDFDPNQSVGFGYRVTYTGNNTPAQRADPANYDQAWVPIADLRAQDQLIFTENTTANTATLTEFISSDGARRNVRNVSAIPSSGGDFVINFSTFDPMVDGGADIFLDWDEPYSTSSTDLMVDVTNSPGVPQFINAVSEITVTGTGNTGITLSSFTPGVQTPAAAAGTNWERTFDLTTGNLFVNRPASGVVGGQITATFEVTQDDGTGSVTASTLTGTQNIRWRTPTLTAEFATLASRPFWENFEDIGWSVSVSSMATAANSDLSYVLSGGNQFTNLTTAVADSLTDSQTLTFNSRVYKDNRTTLPTIATTAALTRPATVVTGSTPYTASLTDTDTPTIPTFQTPNLTLTGVADTDTLTAYNATNNTRGAILTGDFETGNGMALQSGANNDVAEVNFGILMRQPGFYWFGQPGSTAPTIEAEALAGSGAFNPITLDVTRTVTFSAANLSGSNVPPGWSTVTYTFRGVLVNTAQRLRIS
ncbi:MAG: hypothetical protein OXU53_02040, partial [Deltaproteobacteria bacterium]|nr:hypothetical protein [Deltaproteobacteria bacterium]